MRIFTIDGTYCSSDSRYAAYSTSMNSNLSLTDDLSQSTLRLSVVRVTGASSKRISPAALIAAKLGHQTWLIYRVHADRGHGKDRRKGHAVRSHRHVCVLQP